MEHGEFSISLLQSIRMMKDAWNDVKAESIKNGFRKSGCVKPVDQCFEYPEEDEVFVVELPNFDSFESNVQNLSEYLSCDTVLTTSEELNNEAIINQVQISEDNDCDIEDIDDQGDELPLVSHKQAREALNNLGNFILQSGQEEGVIGHLRALQMFLECHPKPLRQSTLDNFIG